MQNAEQETLNELVSADSLTGGISVADFKQPKQQSTSTGRCVL